MAFTPGVRLGVYEVVALIGAGGMGQVYRARDTKLKRDVALKVLPELFALDPDRLARFKREAQVLASVNHTNIAAIYGLEESDGVHALVLELVEGPTLAEVIEQRQAAGFRLPATGQTRMPRDGESGQETGACSLKPDTANGVLLAVPFDANTLEVRGRAVSLIEGIGTGTGTGTVHFQRRVGWIAGLRPGNSRGAGAKAGARRS